MVMRRALLLVVLIAGCGAHRTSGPAWPKMAASETDGGESLAPRTAAASAVAAAADDDDDDVKIEAAVPADKPAAAATDKPASTTPTVTTPEEAITIEEIVIEIDD